MASLFNEHASKMKASWNDVYFADNTKSKELLQIDYNAEFGQCMKDMVYSMLDTGAMKDPTKKEELILDPDNVDAIAPEDQNWL